MSSQLVERIALALERQVEQHDASVARNLSFRDENIQRHNRERDEELASARRDMSDLIQRMDTALQSMSEYRTVLNNLAERIQALESPNRHD